jgi:hypothetical protein
MINDSKVTKDEANGLKAPRILARQLARPLTEDEINHVTGGMIARAEIGGATAARRADTCSTTGCPANDSDC